MVPCRICIMLIHPRNSYLQLSPKIWSPKAEQMSALWCPQGNGNITHPRWRHLSSSELFHLSKWQICTHLILIFPSFHIWLSLWPWVTPYSMLPWPFIFIFIQVWGVGSQTLRTSNLSAFGDQLPSPSTTSLSMFTYYFLLTHNNCTWHNWHVLVHVYLVKSGFLGYPTS